MVHQEVGWGIQHSGRAGGGAQLAGDAPDQFGDQAHDQEQLGEGNQRPEGVSGPANTRFHGQIGDLAEELGSHAWATRSQNSMVASIPLWNWSSRNRSLGAWRLSPGRP